MVLLCRAKAGAKFETSPWEFVAVVHIVSALLVRLEGESVVVALCTNLEVRR